jgi:nucleoside-diphosphate-sugar epimerase
MMLVEWFLHPKRNSFLKVLFDAFAAFLAFVSAFVARVFIEYLFSADGEFTSALVARYFDFFGTYLPLFVVLTPATFALLGLYKTEPPEENYWKPLRVLGAVSLVPLVWSLVLYYMINYPFFPRGVNILAGVFLLAFAGVPRIIKYYLKQQMIISFDAHNKKKVRNVLVIGGAGYIGAQVCETLLEQGYRVRVLDSLIFGDFSIERIKEHKNFSLHVGDFRNVEAAVTAMRGMDAVIHLGGIVGDPACSLDDDFTIDVNLTATAMLAEVCKVLKIERFVFASTCSVYGEGGEEVLTEDSELHPVSLYAKTKIASENVLKELATANFSPTILRFGTLFGISPRPRFDLFVNLLSARAVVDNKIHVFGGSQWRPFVHVRDISKTIASVLSAPLSRVGNQTFNVGSNKNNYQLVDVAKRIQELVPETVVAIDSDKEDARNYRVSFDKLKSVLGLELEVGVDDGIVEIRDAFRLGVLDDYTLEKYSNVAQTQRILSESNAITATVARNLQPSPQLRSTPNSMLRKVGT